MCILLIFLKIHTGHLVSTKAKCVCVCVCEQCSQVALQLYPSCLHLEAEKSSCPLHHNIYQSSAMLGKAMNNKGSKLNFMEIKVMTIVSEIQGCIECLFLDIWSSYWGSQRKLWMSVVIFYYVPSPTKKTNFHHTNSHVWPLHHLKVSAKMKTKFNPKSLTNNTELTSHQQTAPALGWTWYKLFGTALPKKHSLFIS